MRFLIVFPDWGYFPLPYRRTIPPLSPAVIAGILSAYGEVVYCDERLEAVPFHEQFDLVFISAMTNQAHRADEIAREFAQRGQTVIMGGVHPSLLPNDASLSAARSVFIGECEETLPRFLEDWLHQTIKPQYVCTGTPSVQGATAKPDRSIYRGRGYLPIDPIQFFRGCRLACEACSVPQTQGKLVSFRPSVQVLEEISTACDYLFFINDDLYFHRSALSPIFKGMIGMNKQWLGLGASDMAADDDFLSLLHDSGCWLLYLDFGPREALALNNPERMTGVLNQLRQRIIRFKDAGIKLIASFTFGYDFDTRDIFDRTVDFCHQNGIDEAEFHLLVPYPRTRMAEKLVRQQRIISTTWSDYTATRAVFQPRNMTVEELEEGYRRAWRRFFHLPETGEFTENHFEIQSLRAFPEITPTRTTY